MGAPSNVLLFIQFFLVWKLKKYFYIIMFSISLLSTVKSSKSVKR